MKNTNTKQKILIEAVKLFAKKGYEAVSVEMIARAVGIKAPSLYKHYKSKQDIFKSILKEMERRDAENVIDFSLPQDTKKVMPEAYNHISIDSFIEYCKQQFRYWTKDEFASSFRKMLTIEQYRNEEMNMLYHQYLGAGPLQYTTDLLGSQEMAFALYSTMYLLYSIYDNASKKDSVYTMLLSHLAKWHEQWIQKEQN